MAVTVSGSVTVGVNATDTSTSNTLSSDGDVVQLRETYTLTYTDTAPDPAITAEWSGSLSLLTSTPQTLDLTALTGPRGQTVTFATVRLVYLYHSAGTTSVTVGNGTNPWTPGWSSSTNTAALPPDSRLVWENRTAAGGWAVSGSVKTIKLDPGAATATVRVIVLGS